MDELCGDLPLVVEGVGYGMGRGENFVSKFDLDVIHLNGNKKEGRLLSPLNSIDDLQRNN